MVANSPYDALDDRMVMRLLATLPPRQRAHLVLRYLEQLTIAETAEVMRCSMGTVKSESAKALTKLRDELSRAGLKELT